MKLFKTTLIMCALVLGFMAAYAQSPSRPVGDHLLSNNNPEMTTVMKTLTDAYPNAKTNPGFVVPQGIQFPTNFNVNGQTYAQLKAYFVDNYPNLYQALINAQKDDYLNAVRAFLANPNTVISGRTATTISTN